MLPSDVTHDLESLLADARRFGFLGPGPVADQVARSLAFASLAGGAPSGPAIDLGSGGGLPGLVLAALWGDSEWLLLDSNGKRARWLQTAVDKLGMSSRVAVLCERAELTGRGRRRHSAQLITARGFGAPAPTAECSAPLLRTGGRLLVADPPEQGKDRWPQDGLAQLGLELEASDVVVTAIGHVSMSRLVATTDCGPKFPRRVGLPFKRPLF
jgi:16S rRNA (guanine527-N7)-methyltransferase